MFMSLEKCVPGKLVLNPNPESLGWVAKYSFHKILQEEQILGDDAELVNLNYLRPFFSANLAAVTKKVNLRRVFAGDLEIRTSLDGAPLVFDGVTLTPVEVTPIVVNDEIGENDSAVIALTVKFEASWLITEPETSLETIFRGIEMGAYVTIKTPEEAPSLRLAG